MPDFFFADINECKAGKHNCAANANCQNTFEDIIRCFILYFIYFISFAYYIIIIKKKTKNNKCLIRQGCHDSGRPITVVPELKKKYVKSSKATYDN